MKQTLTIRIPDALRKKLKRMCAAEDKPVSDLVLSEYLLEEVADGMELKLRLPPTIIK